MVKHFNGNIKIREDGKETYEIVGSIHFMETIKTCPKFPDFMGSIHLKTLPDKFYISVWETQQFKKGNNYNFWKQ